VLPEVQTTVLWFKARIKPPPHGDLPTINSLRRERLQLSTRWRSG